MTVASIFDIKITRRLILLFAAISIFSVGISIASLVYLNFAINKLSHSLYGNVYHNSERLLSADRDLHQAALALLSAVNGNFPEAEHRKFIQLFEENNAEAEAGVLAAKAQIYAAGAAYLTGEQDEQLITELKKELDAFDASFSQWKESGQRLLAQETTGVELTSDPSSFIMVKLNAARGSLDQSRVLIDSYAEQVKEGFQSRKSSLFAIYTLVLSVLLLVIIYLGRRILTLQKEIVEEQNMYQLIGETMSDFIILTDPNGLILYASPSHSVILDYVPQKGVPLSNYIREPEIAWAKLKSVVHGSPRLSELRMRGAEGHWVWLETKVTPVQGSGKFPAQFMLVSREITERKQYEERLHKLAFYDHLTSIPNRAHFKMYMENLISQPAERRQNLALALLDCDRFKQLNDTLGHLAGDEFLQLLSSELQQTVKGAGQAFRIGGDEFAVVLHRFTSPDMLDEMLKRLLQLFNKSWSIHNGASFHTSASIGVALYPQDGNSINELLHAADVAMYRSKDRGGNEANLYDPTLDVEYSVQKKG
jgi:diguanylate cyclase (GGDEF)-like protein/PAS domain S-box-containing protein